MGWERRGRKRYYYSAEKVDGRVVKTYHGAGIFGVRAAEVIDDARRRRAADAAAVEAEEALLGPADAATAALDLACDLMAGAALLAAGYRYQDSRWRRRRGGRSRADDQAVRRRGGAEGPA